MALNVHDVGVGRVVADRSRAAAIALLLLASLGIGFLGGVAGSHKSDVTGGQNTTAQQRVVLNESQLISAIAKQVGPSVVSVDVTSQSTQTNFFGFSQPIAQESAGTGFIVSTDGVVVTNRHVIPEGTSSVSVTLSDGTTLTNVAVIGRTSDSDPLDIAFLKIKDAKGKKLQPVTLGDSSKVQVGDRVVAIGNALGQFQNTVTSGIISGHGRSLQAGDESGASLENLQDLFQTDAAINEGNSGGPLVDINGQVIGINTAIAGNAQSIGFAIPINDAKGAINSVLSKGQLLRPFLGVRYVSLTDDLASQNNLSVKRGAYITPGQDGQPSIVPGSPAEKAGLKNNDVITKVDSINIDENTSLTSALGSYNVGDTVTLTVVRGGKTITIKATLGSAPSS